MSNKERKEFEERLKKKLEGIFYPGRKIFYAQDYQRIFGELVMFLYDELTATETVVNIHQKIARQLSAKDTDIIIEKLIEILKSNKPKRTMNG